MGEQENEEGAAADEPNDAEEDDAPPAVTPVRGRRRQLKRAKAEEIAAEWAFAQARDPNAPIEIVFRGDGIGSDGGLAEVIGTMLNRVARLLDSLGGGPAFVEQLSFANSVHIRLRASTEESVRAERSLELAEAMARERSPDDPGVRLFLQEAVTDVEIAAALLADLLEVPADDAPAQAVMYGSAIAGAYKSLATAVARNRIQVTIDAPDRDTPVTLRPAKAERVAEALRVSSKPQMYTIDVFGTLAIADATHDGFGLFLEPAAKSRARVLRGRRLIRGTYTPEAEAAIIEEGLWGHRVRATIQVEQDAIVSTSTVRPPQFTLIAVELAER